MNKLALIAIALLAFSCKKESEESVENPNETTTETTITEPQTPEALGQEIFEGKGNCISCHQVDQKVIGPSLQDIAKIYKEKNGNMVSFFKGEGEAIVDPEQFALMQANIELTKTFTDEELKGLEAYINSNLK